MVDDYFEAKEYGRYLFNVEGLRKLDTVIARARENRIPKYLLNAVAEGWSAERTAVVYGEY